VKEGKIHILSLSHWKIGRTVQLNVVSFCGVMENIIQPRPNVDGA
jgi:hypothetical protein